MVDKKEATITLDISNRVDHHIKLTVTFFVGKKTQIQGMSLPKRIFATEKVVSKPLEPLTTSNEVQKASQNVDSKSHSI